MELLTDDATPIRQIYHLSDFHIRLLKKHDEYREVFSRFIGDLSTDGSAVVVTGDILHSKTELTPECVQLTRWVFGELGKKTPVFVICGTHDANLNNKSRLDSLTPLLSDLRNVYYLNTDGHYRYANLVFGTTNIHGVHPIKSLPPEDGLTQIALFHGDTSVEQLSGYQIAMLGKSHEHKFLADNIAYASSFIQQDHTEPLSGHGYILWDVESCTGTFHEMENDYGYQTVKIVNGSIVAPPEIRAKPRLRFEVENTDKSIADELIRDFCKDLDVQESLVYRAIQQVTTNEHTSVKSLALTEPNALFEKTVPSEMLESILQLHEEFSSSVPETERPVHTDWNLVRLEFTNMFCYRTPVTIDFTDYQGQGQGTLVGIFGRNHSGKSSLVDIILYCLFDKCSRGEKKEVLNCASNEFKCCLTLEISGEIYHIKRVGKKNSKTLKVDVKLEKETPSGLIDLSGTDRIDTNRKIVSLIGTYDDLALTAVSLQNQSNIFIEMTQSGRKKLLNDLMRLDFYEKLHEHANSELKEVATEIKILNRNTDDLTQLECRLATGLSEKESLETQLSDVQQKFDDILKERDSQLRCLKTVDVGLSLPENENLTDIRIELDQLVSMDTCDLESKLKLEEDDYREQMSTFQTNIADINAEIKLCQKKKKILHQINWTIEELKTQRNELENTVAPEFVEKELQFLTDLKTKVDGFDNDDLIDAGRMIDQRCDFLGGLPKFVARGRNLTMSEVLLELHRIEENSKTATENAELDQQIENLRAELVEQNAVRPSDAGITELKKQIQHAKYIEDRKQRLTEIIKHFNTLKSNEDINSAVRKLDAQVNGFKLKRTKLQQLLIKQTAENSVTEKAIATKKELIAKLEVLSRRQHLLKCYTENVHKDGIPYLQLKEIVPLLEQRINEILSLLTDFTLEIQMDGKDIDIVLVRNGSTTNIVMASGFEKFVASVAIRIGLLDVSKLPRPKFMIIDEGFGAFDSDNLSSVDLLFDYLRLNFTTVIVISHIDSLKNEVRHVICPDDLKRKAKK